MNILIYVVTMLMLLTVLTYSRLDYFRILFNLETGFTEYMEKLERATISELGVKMYKAIPIRTDKEKLVKARNRESPRLPLHSLVNKESRVKNAIAHFQMRDFFKQLVKQLYKDQPFFLEIQSKHPGFLDDLLNEIERSADDQNQKIKKTEELVTLELSDPELQAFFVNILNGVPVELEKKRKKLSEKTTIDTELEELNESKEPIIEIGRESILDYITVRPATKLRIYLAPRKLLEVIYITPQMIENVIAVRNSLYKEIIDDEDQKEALSKKFFSQFALQGQASHFDAILNFDVTATDPKAYE